MVLILMVLLLLANMRATLNLAHRTIRCRHTLRLHIRHLGLVLMVRTLCHSLLLLLRALHMHLIRWLSSGRRHLRCLRSRTLTGAV